MTELDLTPDEQYLRAYYLSSNDHRYRSIMHELQYPLPGIVFALISWLQSDPNFLWIGFVWLLGVIVIRNFSQRWAKAAIGLVKKYEARIVELEAK